MNKRFSIAFSFFFRSNGSVLSGFTLEIKEAAEKFEDWTGGTLGEL